MSKEQHRYAGRKVALLTQHGKESLLAPILLEGLGCIVELVEGYDTDQLGTFTREQARPGSQRDAALRKARVGMELSGCPLGLASEGAFVPDPYAGFMPWDIEMLVFVDAEHGWEVTATAHGPARSAQRILHDIDGLHQFALEAGFPEHQLVVRPDDGHQRSMQKGLANWADLLKAFESARAISRAGAVFVESDLRAFCNPTRQGMIRNAAHDLVKRLACACPSCRAPGFAVTSHRPGLPCRLCGAPTALPLASLWTCAACGLQHEEAIAGAAHADPQRCDHCNP